MIHAWTKRLACGAFQIYLDGLVPRQGEVWNQVERLIASRLPKAYDEAVTHLIDLRDVAERAQGAAKFRGSLAALIGQYSKRPSSLERLKRARLMGDE
ncbi:MAG: hypothetical protein WKF84_13930 [Pyrinomonadaceae bacterium]